MAHRQITHVSKDYLDNITEVGVRNHWRQSVPVTVYKIRGGIESYFVHEAGSPVGVNVVNANPPHLRTDADWTSKNNLDNLPRL